jgi:hypothetical protein
LPLSRTPSAIRCPEGRVLCSALVQSLFGPAARPSPLLLFLRALPSGFSFLMRSVVLRSPTAHRRFYLAQ